MLKLVLTQGYTFAANDYGRPYAFRIYNEDDTPFDATTYGLPTIKVFGISGNAAIQPLAGSWTAQNQGAGAFSFAQSNCLTASGPHYIEVQLEKPGVATSTGRRRITVTPSP
ncbi:hypothetical protein [Nitrososphaera viennensis]|uniref:Uncharacterized protein n=2 Tax=Nitrososphaera viennensis TaxID=1034015 RepID=A0A060HNB1_9ARCH|nr:hypothetical protein [Nitrososphaera viennensis]AIC16938.1 hypothetical protein NVIE_026680 [Nitrososphaera viennensis EN76]UVS68841.1 hypothetical protein NWT39_13150 [Nitrososphaera viennensis]CBX88948.1 hypothetical protein [Nitrososphaera phage Pro-Nvie1]